MFKSLFDKDYKAKKKIAKLYEKAVFEQRNGRLRDYGELMTEISRLETELSDKKNSEGKGNQK